MSEEMAVSDNPTGEESVVNGGEASAASTEDAAPALPDPPSQSADEEPEDIKPIVEGNITLSHNLANTFDDVFLLFVRQYSTIMIIIKAWMTICSVIFSLIRVFRCLSYYNYHITAEVCRNKLWALSVVTNYLTCSRNRSLAKYGPITWKWFFFTSVNISGREQ